MRGLLVPRPSGLWHHSGRSSFRSRRTRIIAFQVLYYVDHTRWMDFQDVTSFRAVAIIGPPQCKPVQPSAHGAAFKATVVGCGPLSTSSAARSSGAARIPGVSAGREGVTAEAKGLITILFAA